MYLTELPVCSVTPAVAVSFLRISGLFSTASDTLMLVPPAKGVSLESAPLLTKLVRALSDTVAPLATPI